MIPESVLNDESEHVCRFRRADWAAKLAEEALTLAETAGDLPAPAEIGTDTAEWLPEIWKLNEL